MMLKTTRNAGRLKFKEVKAGDFLEEYSPTTLRMSGFYYVIRKEKVQPAGGFFLRCIKWAFNKEKNSGEHIYHPLTKSDFAYRGYRIARAMPLGSREEMEFQAFKDSL